MALARLSGGVRGLWLADHSGFAPRDLRDHPEAASGRCEKWARVAAIAGELPGRWGGLFASDYARIGTVALTSVRPTVESISSRPPTWCRRSRMLASPTPRPVSGWAR